jgi:Tfp pilus assembly protein PilX
MTRRLVREEEGWALITALILMVVMIGIALSTLSFVDVQTRESGNGRKRETAFNLAEAAMNAQIFALSQSWPGAGAAPVNSTLRYLPCTQASTGPHCPDAATIAGLISSPDTASGMTWQTSVRDNVGAAQSFYSDALTATAPGWDSNGDKSVWVRAQATARGKKRALVALVRVEEVQETLPHAALISGRLDISNMGHKPIIDAGGNNAVSVRCTPALLELTPCLGHDLVGGLLSTALADLNALLDFQVTPNVTQTGYTGGVALSAGALLRLKNTAIANGTYYTSCPASLTGAIVYIDVAAGCDYNANSVYNSAAAPGFLIMNGGMLTLEGTTEYYGVIYHPTTATTNAVTVQGDATVHGGVLVDGTSVFVAGSSHLNIDFDPVAFDAIRSYGTAGVIQNTWREIQPS